MNYLRSFTLLAALCFFQNIPTVLSKFSINSVTPKGSLPPPRADHSSVVLETQDGYFFLVHGGRNENGALSDTWTYGVNSNSWDELTPLDSKLSNDPPPAMYGAISGFRYVEGYAEPFLYVTLGTGDGATKYYNEMWVMEFKFFTWKKVILDGDIPSGRYGAAGGLEIFAKYDETFQTEFIVSHGIGANGPESDSYRCKLDPIDPYRATWEQIHKPISQYSIFDPHPRHLQGSTFTLEQDLLLFGGCQSSESTGGYCPSSDAWKLEMNHDGRDFASPDGDDGYRYSWVQLPNSTPARVGSAMAKGLTTFEGIDGTSTGTSVVLFSGVNRANDASHRSMFRQIQIDHSEISIYSTQSNIWVQIPQQMVYRTNFIYYSEVK